MPVDDLEAASTFYGDTLGCERGRRSNSWIDWNFYGHQLVTHLQPVPATGIRNVVDGHDVPIPHFGVILTVADFHELAERLARQGAKFVIEPYLRFAGEPGEQWTMFVYDPAGNNLEFKAFADESTLFDDAD